MVAVPGGNGCGGHLLVKQTRKWGLVIRWFRMEGPSLNG
jgi:hypothetical protein